MKKLEFIYALREKLHPLPLEDIEKYAEYYAEMIDDRMDDGMDEESAVRDVGSLDEIASQILADTPLSSLLKEKLKRKRKMTAGEIVLIVLGFPLWFSLLAAAFSVVLSLYVSLWAVIVSLWAVFGALIGCAVGGISGGVVIAVGINVLSGIALISSGLVCAGLSIFMFFACKAATKGVLILTKKIFLGIKKCFVKKEVV